MKQDLASLSRNVRTMIRAGKYVITDHVTKDHPERQIKKDDILEVLKIGNAIEHFPRFIDGKLQYSGHSERYKWVGEDQKDRILSLLITIENNVVVVHANQATTEEAKRYKMEDGK